MAQLDRDIAEEAQARTKASLINTVGIELTIAMDLVEKLGKTLSMGSSAEMDRDFLGSVELTVPWIITMVERALLRLKSYPN